MNIKTLRVSVENKIATYRNRDGLIVCGNKGYAIAFSFDEEWDEFTTKTARFIWNGKYYDQEFEDDICPVPVLNDTTSVTIGVYAGDLKTTTPAEIPCLISILCGDLEPTDENIKEYRDISQQAADEARIAAEEAKIAAEEAKDSVELIVNPTIDVEEIEGGHRITINDAEGEKAFDVMNGKNSESTGGGLTPEQLEQFNELVQWHTDSTYTTMTASISPSNSTYELGSKRDITFTWSFKIGTGTNAPQATLSSLTFRGVPKDVSSKSEKVTGISNTSAYMVSGTRKDGKKETKTATANIYFYNKYYFGYATDPGKLSDAEYSLFIKKLTTESKLSGSRPAFTKLGTESGAVKCPANQYIWLAYPSRLGEAYFEVNGFPGNFEEPIIVEEFENSQGYKEEYYLYRSTEHSLGLVDKFVVY